MFFTLDQATTARMQNREVLTRTATSSSRTLCSLISGTSWAFSRTLSGSPICGSVVGTTTFNHVTTSSHDDVTSVPPLTKIKYLEEGTLSLEAAAISLPVKQEYIYVDSVAQHLSESHQSVSCDDGNTCRVPKIRKRSCDLSLGVLFPDGRPFLQFYFSSNRNIGEEGTAPTWLGEVSILSPCTSISKIPHPIFWKTDSDVHLCGQDLYNSRFHLGFPLSSDVPIVICMEYVVKGPKKDYIARSLLTRKPESS